jgi:hypothetical protein
MKKKLIILFQVLFAIVISCNVCSEGEKHVSSEKSKEMESGVKDSVIVQTNDLILKDTFHIVGVGDMMLGSGYPDGSRLPPGGECTPLLAPVKDILVNADITFGNLEGSFFNSGPPSKICSDPKKCYVFRMPDKFVDCFSECGFDVLNLANNHTGDFGEAACTNTKKLLDEKGIKYVGLLTSSTAIITKDGIKYGICGFAPNTGSCNINDIARAQEIVKELASQCDIVIVSFHGGAEGSSRQNVPRQHEFFYGEDRGDVYNFSHKIIDAGADIVFGHGPHVSRAVEIYNNRFIAYSMGNFCTYGSFNLSGVSGMAPIMHVWVNSKGEFIKGKITPIVQEGEGGPKIDPLKQVITKIRDLTAVDFPENKTTIDDEGNIYK